MTIQGGDYELSLFSDGRINLSRKEHQGQWLLPAGATARTTNYAKMIKRIYDLVNTRSKSASGRVGIGALDWSTNRHLQILRGAKDAVDGGAGAYTDPKDGTKKNFKLPVPATAANIAAMPSATAANPQTTTTYTGISSYVITREHIAAIVDPLLLICDIPEFLNTNWVMLDPSADWDFEVKDKTNPGNKTVKGAGGIKAYRYVAHNFNYAYINRIVTELEWQNRHKGEYIPTTAEDTKNDVSLPRKANVTESNYEVLPDEIADYLYKKYLVVVDGLIKPAGHPGSGDPTHAKEASTDTNHPYAVFNSTDNTITLKGAYTGTYDARITFYTYKNNVTRPSFFYKPKQRSKFYCRGACVGLCHGTCITNCNGCDGACLGFCSGTQMLPDKANVHPSSCGSNCTNFCIGSCTGQCQAYCKTTCSSNQHTNGNGAETGSTAEGNTYMKSADKNNGFNKTYRADAEADDPLDTDPTYDPLKNYPKYFENDKEFYAEYYDKYKSS